LGKKKKALIMSLKRVNRKAEQDVPLHYVGGGGGNQTPLKKRERGKPKGFLGVEQQLNSSLRMGGKQQKHSYAKNKRDSRLGFGVYSGGKEKTGRKKKSNLAIFKNGLRKDDEKNEEKNGVGWENAEEWWGLCVTFRKLRPHTGRKVSCGRGKKAVPNEFLGKLSKMTAGPKKKKKRRGISQFNGASEKNPTQNAKG